MHTLFGSLPQRLQNIHRLGREQSKCAEFVQKLGGGGKGKHERTDLAGKSSFLPSTGSKRGQFLTLGDGPADHPLVVRYGVDSNATDDDQCHPQGLLLLLLIIIIIMGPSFFLQHDDQSLILVEEVEFPPEELHGRGRRVITLHFAVHALPLRGVCDQCKRA